MISLALGICFHIDHGFKESYGIVHKIRIFKRQVNRVFRAIFGTSAASLAVVRYVRQAVLHGNLMGEAFFSANTASYALFLIHRNLESL